MKNQIQDINSNTLYISKVQKLLPQITTAMTVLSFATIIKPQLDSNLNFNYEKIYFNLKGIILVKVIKRARVVVLFYRSKAT